jgi:hypothetical protein
MSHGRAGKETIATDTVRGQFAVVVDTAKFHHCHHNTIAEIHTAALRTAER